METDKAIFTMDYLVRRIKTERLRNIFYMVEKVQGKICTSVKSLVLRYILVSLKLYDNQWCFGFNGSVHIYLFLYKYLSVI
jgi:hypothetical protein